MRHDSYSRDFRGPSEPATTGALFELPQFITQTGTGAHSHINVSVKLRGVPVPQRSTQQWVKGMQQSANKPSWSLQATTCKCLQPEGDKTLQQPP